MNIQICKNCPKYKLELASVVATHNGFNKTYIEFCTVGGKKVILDKKFEPPPNCVFQLEHLLILEVGESYVGR